MRDAATGTRVTYSPKVFIPLTMLCRDRCGYCTFAQPPARLDAPYLTPDAGAARSPRRAPRPAATRRCSRSASGPRSATRSARRVARRARLRLDGRLPGGHVPARARRDRPAPPRQRRRARPPTSSAALRPVAPSQGMMIETLRRRPRRATAARPTRRPSAAWPPSRPPASSRIPFTTGILVGIGETAADRIDALEAIAASAPPPRPRAGGDRPELPAEARHRDARRRRRARPTSYLVADRRWPG